MHWQHRGMCWRVCAAAGPKAWKSCDMPGTTEPQCNVLHKHVQQHINALRHICPPSGVPWHLSTLTAFTYLWCSRVCVMGTLRGQPTSSSLQPAGQCRRPCRPCRPCRSQPTCTPQKLGCQAVAHTHHYAAESSPECSASARGVDWHSPTSQADCLHNAPAMPLNWGSAAG
jgi:hypothetical protein